MKVVDSPEDGVVLSALETMYPSELRVVEGYFSQNEFSGSTYGYVSRGQAEVSASGIQHRLDRGGYFCVPGAFDLHANGSVVLFVRYGFVGTHSAGKIENSGRLSYIDGCSSTILVSPPRVGDPVLNLLHFPAGILQTKHTHPSIRLGVVARGEGLAFGGRNESDSWEIPLREGDVFLLGTHEFHAFQTVGSQSKMDIVSYHPDSDWGPTDEAHPMLTRTFIQQ